MDLRDSPSGRCTTCSGYPRRGRFDVTVRGPDEGRERYFFGVLASLCRTCGRFRIEPDAAIVHEIDDRDVVSAIGSDRDFAAGWV